MKFASQFSLEFIVYIICCLFQKPVFEGVAHEALSECMVSLQSASDAIKNRKVNLAITSMFISGGEGLAVFPLGWKSNGVASET